MADKSLIQFILDLLSNPDKLAEFKDDPKGALGACGLTNVTPDAVHDALVIAQDNDDVSFDRDYHTGGNHVAGASVPPPPPPAPHGDHDAGVKYLDKYITNNYIDDRDTIIDQSVNQHIDTGGGDFDQTIDNHSVNATGDGAVAAGGNIENSPITHGNGNVIGDDNKAVTGSDNTTAFGSGSAVKDVSVDHGGAFSVNGDANGDASTTDSHNVTIDEDNDVTKTIHSNNTTDSHAVDNSDQDNSHHDVLSHNVHVDVPVL